jgi:hypothetical protein
MTPTWMLVCLLCCACARAPSQLPATVLHAESAAAAAAEAADAVPSLVVVYQGILMDYLRKWRCCR